MTGLPSKRLAVRVARAARLWAVGNSWEAIARLLVRRPQTCQQWRTQYREWWNHVTRLAQEERWRETCAICDQGLRKLLRSADAKYRQRAATLILQTARRDPTMLSAEAVAEAQLVCAREGIGQVRVLRVTANEGAGEATPLASPHPL